MNRVILVLAICMIALVVPTSAIIINVPDDYTTIQVGIDVSSDGDTVLVQPDTYYENINFNGHNVVLGSLFLTTGDDSYISSTTIDGNQSGAVVTFSSGEDATTVVVGFTIQNGSQRGINCTNGANPQILSNIIRDNNGGGILCYNTNAKISENIITGNIANEGGGIYCYGVSSTINNNIIWGNTAVVNGGGIFYYYSWCSILNNTIVENTAVGGGGIYYDAYATASILNNIVWDNNGDQLYVNYNSPVVTYSDIQGGWAGEGNIDSDPLFVAGDPYDFHLQPNSPCIDAGDPSSPYDPDGTFADMGALYYNQAQPIPTLSEWGMIVLALLLLAICTVAVIRRRRAVIAKN